MTDPIKDLDFIKDSYSERSKFAKGSAIGLAFERVRAALTAAAQPQGSKCNLCHRDMVKAMTPPEGMALVPVEPTEEMIKAGIDGSWNYESKDPVIVNGYKAMIAAAQVTQ